MDKVNLSLKEIQIIQLICKELTPVEIAIIMKLSPATIENYRRKIQKKIGAKNIVGIAIYALLNGFIHKNFE